MAVISETSDDSTGGDPNKKLDDEEEEEEEAEEDEKKPDEEEENQIAKPKKSKNLNRKEPKNRFAEIPDGVIEHCFAIVRRRDYLNLSLTCKAFLRLITSPQLYNKRSSLDVTEHVLYASVGFPRPDIQIWYILHRNKPSSSSSRSLRRIDRLPPMPLGSAVVTIGWGLYVIGGRLGTKPIPDVTLIDCRLHTYHSLPEMRLARDGAATGVIDGKIYVIGGCKLLDLVEAFDPKTEIWNRYTIVDPLKGETVLYAVMQEKLYISDKTYCYAYDPKEGKLNHMGVNKLSHRWSEPSCVIDDLLFCMNQVPYVVKSRINVYDPKANTWRPLMGLQSFPGDIVQYECKMVGFGGKLMVLGTDDSRVFSRKNVDRREIRCVEIGLERRDGGEIWGKIESVESVLTILNSSSVSLCRTVTV